MNKHIAVLIMWGLISNNNAQAGNFIKYNDLYLVYSNPKIEKIDDKLYIPIGIFAKLVDAKWENANDKNILKINNTVLSIKSNNMYYLNDSLILKTEKTIIKDKILYLPLASTARLLNFQVFWNSREKIAKLARNVGEKEISGSKTPIRGLLEERLILSSQEDSTWYPSEFSENWNYTTSPNPQSPNGHFNFIFVSKNKPITRVRFSTGVFSRNAGLQAFGELAPAPSYDQKTINYCKIVKMKTFCKGDVVTSSDDPVEMVVVRISAP
jgi:hypothetical protein